MPGHHSCLCGHGDTSPAEITRELPVVISFREFQFHKGAHHAVWTSTMDSGYLPVTFGADNPHTHFLLHSSEVRYISKLPFMEKKAQIIKLAFRGQAPCVIANIHGLFSRHQRESLDDWSAR